MQPKNITIDLSAFLTPMVFLFLLVTAISSIVFVIALSVMLVKRDKALRRIKFTYSVYTNVNIEYELDTDKKIQLLMAENEMLRTEVAALKGSPWQKFKFSVSMLVIVITSYAIVASSMAIRSIQQKNKKK